MSEELRVSKKYLEEIIRKASNSLVGRCMKRFEIFDNNADIKKAIKELIYESYRDSKGLIESFEKGIKFIEPKEEK